MPTLTSLLSVCGTSNQSSIFVLVFLRMWQSVFRGDCTMLVFPLNSMYCFNFSTSSPVLAFCGFDGRRPSEHDGAARGCSASPRGCLCRAPFHELTGRVDISFADSSVLVPVCERLVRVFVVELQEFSVWLGYWLCVCPGCLFTPPIISREF